MKFLWIIFFIIFNLSNAFAFEVESEINFTSNKLVLDKSFSSGFDSSYIELMFNYPLKKSLLWIELEATWEDESINLEADKLYIEYFSKKGSSINVGVIPMPVSYVSKNSKLFSKDISIYSKALNINKDSRAGIKASWNVDSKNKIEIAAFSKQRNLGKPSAALNWIYTNDNFELLLSSFFQKGIESKKQPSFLAIGKGTNWQIEKGDLKFKTQTELWFSQYHRSIAPIVSGYIFSSIFINNKTQLGFMTALTCYIDSCDTGSHEYIAQAGWKIGSNTKLIFEYLFERDHSIVTNKSIAFRLKSSFK